MACLFTFLAAQLPALSQELPDLGVEVEDGAQMLLEADTLIYDNNDDTVSAAGSVRIDYGGNKMVADRVTYDRNTRRLIATGNVQIVQTDGTKVFSDKIDITDDFADGFVNTLRVETVDKTYFAAESADRRGGFLTTFNNGVYTACEPCEEKPDQPPIWRLKAKKIIWNSKAKTVRFENSGFEFFGVQLARFPAFEIADPTVKRKSGFLFPGITYQSELGVGVTVPYYFALSPTYDLTVVANGFSEQGFLGEAEFRQRFNNGEYSITAAAINQLNPEAFDVATVDRGPIGDPNKFRAMMGTKGQFAINSRWDVGWDILLQTDKNFSNTYSIGGYSQGVHTSQIYLRGLEDRNYFDLAALRFDVQEDALNSNPSARSDKQPWVLPTWDYSYTADEPVYGGELNFDMNLRVLSRDNEDISPTTWNSDPTLAPFVQRIRGIEGESARLTAEGEWKRSFVSDGGLVLTSLLAFQADTTHVNASQSSIDAINSMANNPVIDAGTDIRSAYNRFMATAGLEMRFPVLFSSTSASHILEPTAQVFARPDEGYGGTLGIPNEDAQSFVFDATTLFERDKFSGYDRVEGGTRANLGLRYAATYDNGWALNGLAGQSYHLAGRNSFDSPDFVNVGAYSGLETETSDYVGLFGFSAPNGLSASVSARLDERTLEMRRGEFKVGYSTDALSLSARYAYIQAQPLYGFPNDREETSFGGSARFKENWRVFGSGTYDFQSNVLIKNSIGFAYDDECFTYLMSYSQKRTTGDEQLTQTIGFRLSFRTLGDIGGSTADVVDVIGTEE